MIWFLCTTTSKRTVLAFIKLRYDTMSALKLLTSGKDGGRHLFHVQCSCLSLPPSLRLHRWFTVSEVNQIRPTIPLLGPSKTNGEPFKWLTDHIKLEIKQLLESNKWSMSCKGLHLHFCKRLTLKTRMSLVLIHAGVQKVEIMYRKAVCKPPASNRHASLFHRVDLGGPDFQGTVQEVLLNF